MTRLFDPEPLPLFPDPAGSSTAPRRPRWERLSAAGDKCGSHWRHTSGWEIRHCGHPTALWPYMLTDPAGVGHLAPNGRCWPSLNTAKEAAAFLGGFEHEN